MIGISNSTAAAVPAKPVKVTSVDLRDGQQSLLATRLKTEDMLPILEKMDRVGFYCAEVWGGATFDVCVRYLNEDPWDRLRAIKKHMKRTPLRMLLRGQSLVGYRHYADDMVERFVASAAAAGIDIFLIFDILNYVNNCETAIRAAQAAGKRVAGLMVYATGPVYSVEFFQNQARDFEKLGVESVQLEDPSGILTPQKAGTLIRALKESVKVPVHLQCHCTGGMADMAYLEAIRAGVDVIDTDISAFSLGTAHPPTESMVVALEDTPYATGLDLDLLNDINKYFLSLRAKYKEFETAFTGVDVAVLQHQIPGGMLSNLESQLKQMGAGDKIGAVLKEVHKLRADFGYPPLGTPVSQIIGAQAAVNVMCGERYKMLSQETKDYVRGLYGRPPGAIEPELEKKALAGKARISCRPADLLPPEFAKLQAEIGDLAKNTEDVLTFAMLPSITRQFLKKKYE